MKNIKAKQGFTIVELLVVIVVIGILAAITIVSYTGITARANGSKSLSNAQSAQSVAEAYYADMNYYPGTDAVFKTGSTNGTAKLPTTLTIVADAVTTPLNGTTYDSANVKVALSCVTVAASCAAGQTATNITGLRIGYWDYATSGATEKFIYVGNAVVGSTYVY